MAVDLADVMAAIGVRLATIDDLNVFAFPPKSAQPPFAFVNFPESIDFDLTARRGADRITLQVFVGVSDQVDEAVRDAICEFAAASGDRSVKAAIEGGEVGSSVRVQSADFGSISLASGTYAGVIFQLDIVA